METLIIIFLLIGPLLDVLAFYDLDVNTVVRGLYLVLIIFLMFKNKKNIKLLSVLLGIGLISSLFQVLYLDYSYLDTITNTFKILYLPVSILYFKDFEFKKYKKETILSIILFSYIGIYLFSYITKLGANAYLDTDGKTGYRGLFTSINEFSAIVVCLLPIVSNYLKNNKRYLLLSLVLIGNLLCSLLIGTKILMFGLVVDIIYLLYQERDLFIKSKTTSKVFISLGGILLLVISGYLFTKTRVYNNMVIQNSFFKPDNFFGFINEVIFNNRLSFVGNNFNYFIHTNLFNYLFGIGFNNSSIKLVEIDWFDVLFRYGLIWLIMFIYMISKISIKKLDISEKIAFILLIFISLTSGHVLIYPNVCIYLAILANRKELIK